MTVAVLKPSERSPLKFRAGTDDDEFRVEWYSGSGAGGQHRNKHQNSCRITHVPTGTVRTAQTRSRDMSYRDAMAALRAALDEKAAAQAHGAENSTRRAHVGTGQRGDKRRTYRFQDDRVKDDVTGRSAPASRVMAGHFEALW